MKMCQIDVLNNVKNVWRWGQKVVRQFVFELLLYMVENFQL